MLNPVLEADNFELMKQFISVTGGIALEIEIGRGRGCRGRASGNGTADRPSPRRPSDARRQV